MKGDVFGGIGLIGKTVEVYINGKFGRFLKIGIITDYYKSKGKGKYGNLTVTKGQYLIDFGNGKKYWRLRSDFKLI